jgi:D-alanyl-lipoteichoic acid acyltransferase DltB (MBOAT superfamily)
MLFYTFDFAIFFGVVYAGAWLLNRRVVAWKLWMLAASYYFYAYWDWHFCFLLAASTLIAHLGATGVSVATTERSRRIWLAAAIGGLLGLLGYFKYYSFFAVSVDNVLRGVGLGNVVPLLTPTLPIAVSFFTFMAVSYVVDVYRGQLKPATPVDLAVYLSFFPHLVAGPIVRGTELLPQLRQPRDALSVDMARASALIMSGLFKKLVISTYMSNYIVSSVFGSPGAHSAPEVLFAVWGYAVEIYCDFSGYTDIAIGIALLFGIRFPVNFDGPYTSRSLQDFWRRWHITLSRWLRDYLYIPLGGNRGSTLLTARNIMITMVLGGLWHGANWTFLAWGALHGVGQVTGHLRRTYRERQGFAAESDTAFAKVRQRFFTFQFVSLGWLFFNSSSMSSAFTMIGRLFTGWLQPSPLVTPLLVATIAGVIALQYVPRRVVDNAIAAFARAAAPVQIAALGLGLLCTTTLMPAGVQSFIYYKF